MTTPGVFSYVTGYWIISNVRTIGDSAQDTTSRLLAAASLGGAALAFYLVAGNPMEAVQRGEFLQLGFGYAAGTATAYGVGLAGHLALDKTGS